MYPRKVNYPVRGLLKLNSEALKFEEAKKDFTANFCKVSQQIICKLPNPKLNLKHIYLLRYGLINTQGINIVSSPPKIRGGFLDKEGGHEKIAQK